MIIDGVDAAIIDALRQDGRGSYTAIGRLVGLAPGTVHKRVQDLLDHKVVRVVPVTDPWILGFSQRAMIGLRVEGEVEPVADSLANVAEVTYVVVTAGSFDLLAEVTCRSNEHLSEVLSHRVRKIEHVVSTETFMYLKFRSQTRTWGGD